MAKKLQLSIQEPCHESWDNMTAAEQGRFCASCQKQVVDFTGMSDAQLAAFFKKTSGDSTCGRFYADQLDRSIEIPKKRIPWIKYFFQFALPAFLASAKASSQNSLPIKKPEVCIAPSENVLMIGKVSAPLNTETGKQYQKITITGKVTDENKSPVPFASIMVKGSRQGVSADSIGVFTIGIKLLKGGPIVLEASSVGFKPEEAIITENTGNSNELVIQLKRKVMSEVVVQSYAYSSVRMGMYVGAVSVMKTSRQIPLVQSPEEKPSMLKVYPNPVMTGASINIDCSKLEEGYYTYQLFSMTGQQIEQKQIWIDAEAGIINMEIPSVAAGSYILTLTNRETRKKFTEKILVQ